MRARAVAVCFLPTPAMRRFLKTDAVGEHRHIAATPALRRFPRPCQLEMPLYTRASRIRVSLSAEREDMDPECLVEASRTASILWAQRQGYLRRGAEVARELKARHGPSCGGEEVHRDSAESAAGVQASFSPVGSVGRLVTGTRSRHCFNCSLTMARTSPSGRCST